MSNSFSVRFSRPPKWHEFEDAQANIARMEETGNSRHLARVVEYCLWQSEFYALDNARIAGKFADLGALATAALAEIQPDDTDDVTEY